MPEQRGGKYRIVYRGVFVIFFIHRVILNTLTLFGDDETFCRCLYGCRYTAVNPSSFRFSL